MARPKGRPLPKEHRERIAAAMRERGASWKELRELGQKLTDAAASGDTLAQAALAQLEEKEPA